MTGRKLFALLCALPLAAYAEWGKFEFDFDHEKPWVELQAQLPPHPKPENLLPFEVSRTSRNKYFVDAASISVGEDDVVRYALLVKSSAGASNVTFEGIRCQTRERKLYAFGHSDNTWSRAKTSKWERIEKHNAQSLHQMMLYSDFFCPGLSIVKTPKEAIQALKWGIHPRAVKSND